MCFAAGVAPDGVSHAVNCHSWKVPSGGIIRIGSTVPLNPAGRAAQGPCRSLPTTANLEATTWRSLSLFLQARLGPSRGSFVWQNTS